MNKTYYVCKYTPIELLESLGGECENFNHMPEGFDLADQVSHPNICGFGKTLLEGVMEGKIKELVLVSCCDTIRSVYDILLESGKLDFLYILDVLHCDSACSRERMAVQLKGWRRLMHSTKAQSLMPENSGLLSMHRRKSQSPILQCLAPEWGRNYLK